MQKVKGIKLACLAAFATLPLQAYALGVGKLTMHSALDEPLNATIELTAVTPTELQSLEVSLGSASVFQMAGIDRNELLRSITFSLVKENGKDKIRLRTEQPFRDPFLHFIVNATWANGSMLREYTALLDPPSYLTGTPAAIEAPTAQPVAVRPAAPAATMKKTAPAAPLAAPAAKPQADKLGPSGIAAAGYTNLRPGSSYGPVRKGDALWNIAEEVKAGTQLGIAQVMMAIYKQNPDAFLRNNINFIRVGETLQIPSDVEIQASSRRVAQQELRAQMEEWQNYKDSLAGGTRVADSGTGEGRASRQAPGQTDTARKVQQPAARASEDDVLKIVRAKVEGAEAAGSGDKALSASDKATQTAEIASYQEKVNMLEESLASSELEKKELSQRVALLEEQIDKANKLIDMQNSDLALLQGQVGKSKPDTGIAAPIKPVESTGQAAKLPAPDITPATPVQPAVQKKPEAAKKPPVAEKKEVKTRVRAQPPAEEKGFFGSLIDSVMSSWMVMMGAGLALLLVLVGGFVVMRRRRSIAEFEDSIISGTAVLDISTAESTEPSDSRSETSFLSDFVPGMGNMQADEVDPLAEAEVYMAYGRDEQAEEVLKDAAAKNPDRHELKLKLLEIYQGRKDIASFETLAEELYPADGNVPMEVWSKVVEMGKIVNPDNPLFQGDLNVQEKTLFGDKERKDNVELGDLLDAGTMDEDEAELMDALKDEEITEEIPEMDSEETTEQITEEITEELPESTEKDSAEAAGTAKADDFPAPDGEVLDLDLGDFKPDEDHETDSFDLDSLGLNLDDLDVGNEEDGNELTGENEVDFNLDDIDLDLGSTAETETDESSTVDMSGLEGIEDINLDLESEESPSTTASDTSEMSMQDETLEFADLSDLTMSEDDTGAMSQQEASAESESSAEMAAGANETWDEAGTKLDLARAYIEMDDKESAQSILEEVIKEGTDTQKNEARDMMNQINAG